MTDLDIAKNELYEENLTLAIVKNGAVLFETRSHRISGFLEAVETLGGKLEGAAVADRVVGKAVAFLCVYAKIRAVYAAVLSRKAHAVLKKNRINCEWNDLVDNVLDVNKKGVCPFENAAVGISDAGEAYGVFKRLRENLKPCR
jgi:hypothetical protein